MTRLAALALALAAAPASAETSHAEQALRSVDWLWWAVIWIWAARAVWEAIGGKDPRPSFIMALLMLILGLMLSAPASAATIAPTPRETAVPFHPGAAPCAGKCSLEWAAAQAGVPTEGKPWAGVIPQGTPIWGMSFAGEGPPRWTEVPMFAAIPLEAAGYIVTIDGRTYLMAKIRDCLNWALLPWDGTVNAALRETGLGEIAAPPPALTPPGSSTPPRVSPPPGSPGGSVTVRWHEPIDVDIDPPEKPGPDPKPPAPVPLPAAGLLLLTGLGLLGWIGRRRNRT